MTKKERNRWINCKPDCTAPRIWLRRAWALTVKEYIQLFRDTILVVFIAYAVQLWRDYSDALARRTFRFSILYLSLLFSALLIDHYVTPWIR